MFNLTYNSENSMMIGMLLLALKIKELILVLIQSKDIDSIMELIAELYSSKSVSIREITELHLFSNLNVGQIPKLSNQSLFSFKRSFKKEYNDNRTNYINYRRIEKAKELLALTKLSIGEIAIELGFQDLLYFTRLFKNKIGIPPSKYRSENLI